MLLWREIWAHLLHERVKTACVRAIAGEFVARTKSAIAICGSIDEDLQQRVPVFRRQQEAMHGEEDDGDGERRAQDVEADTGDADENFVWRIGPGGGWERGHPGGQALCVSGGAKVSMSQCHLSEVHVALVAHLDASVAILDSTLDGTHP